MSEWISVEDRLPEIGTLVLIAVDALDIYFPTISTICVGEVDHIEDGSCWKIGNPILLWDHEFNINHVEVTHWMPLPEPPK